MNEETKELYRNAILLQLNAARSVGLRVQAMLPGMKLAGFSDSDEQDLRKQLRYLEAHGMIERDEKTISKAVEVYLISSSGVAHLDEQGLI